MVAWQTVILPQAEGGLGIIDPELQSQALLGKLVIRGLTPGGANVEAAILAGDQFMYPSARWRVVTISQVDLYLSTAYPPPLTVHSQLAHSLEATSSQPHPVSSEQPGGDRLTASHLEWQG